ncbi:RapGAP/RanGAP domain-containing protein, partial [Planoprotostelium fungivorum]
NTEAEQRYQSAKDAMTRYMLDVEDWKRESSERFKLFMNKKESEISKLRNSVISTIQQDDNQLETLKQSIENYIKQAQEEDVTSETFKPPATPKLEQPGDISARESTVLTNNWTKAKKLFKVLLPYDLPPVLLDYREQSTLREALDEIKQLVQQKKVAQIHAGNLHEFSFFHAEGNDRTSVIPLSSTIGSLRYTSVRLSKTTPEDKDIMLVKNSVNELLASLQKDLDRGVVSDLLLPASHSQPPPKPVGLVVDCPGFEVEAGDPKNLPISEAPVRALMDIDKNTPYYSHYFASRQHTNFYGDAGKAGPVLVSLELPTREQKDLFHNNDLQLRALVRTKYDDEWVFIPADIKSSKRKALQKAIEAGSNYRDKLVGLKLKEINSSVGPTLLSTLEDRLQTKGYKFGVLYVKEGQVEENAMYQNVDGSADLDEFLKFMGTTIKLKGWDGYRGGLDTKSDTTGTQTIFTKHLGWPIIFHISTMLPFYPNDTQQLERKRHLGNDVCVVVFKDGPEPFLPSTSKSEFNHVFAVICKDHTVQSETTHYKISFAYKGGIGMADPLLPGPASFPATQALRELILTKLINAERRAMYAPGFVTKMQKTKELQMMAIVDQIRQASG